MSLTHKVRALIEWNEAAVDAGGGDGGRVGIDVADVDADDEADEALVAHASASVAALRTA